MTKATLNISVQVEDGSSPQTLSIQQGNIDMSGNGGGETLIKLEFQKLGDNFNTSIPLNNVSPNTALSVQFDGGGKNKVTVTGTISISGDKPKNK